MKQIQIQVFTKRCQFGGPSEKDNDYMVGSIMSVGAINENFRTDYLSYELVNMKLTDKDGMVQDFMPHLPFKKGDEHIFERQ